MIIKFPYTEDLKQKIEKSNYKIRSICYPKPTSNENSCYVRLATSQKEEFLRLLALEESNIIVLHHDSDEMPDVATSKNAGLYDCVSQDD